MAATFKVNAGSHANYPTQAAAFNYTNLTFFSGLDSLSEIDTANSKTAGFKFYLDRQWPDAAGPPGANWNNTVNATADSASKYSLAYPSVLKMTPPSGMTTACDDGDGGYHGQTFGDGFYFRMRAAVSGTPFANGPAAWCYPIQFLLGSASLFNEMDMFEIFPGSSDEWHGIIHQWDTSQNPDTDTQGAETLFGLPVALQFHNYDFRWVPMAQNGGTGRFDWWIDDVLKKSQTYTSGNNFSHSDDHDFVIKINTSGPLLADPTNAPDLYVCSVYVWQLPS